MRPHSSLQRREHRLLPIAKRLNSMVALQRFHSIAKFTVELMVIHYGNQSRGYLIGGRPLWPPAVPRLAARPSQSNPRGSGPEVLKRERGHVTAETGVAEVGVFRALQPNSVSAWLNGLKAWESQAFSPLSQLRHHWHGHVYSQRLDLHYINMSHIT